MKRSTRRVVRVVVAAVAATAGVLLIVLWVSGGFRGTATTRPADGPADRDVHRPGPAIEEPNRDTGPTPTPATVATAPVPAVTAAEAAAAYAEGLDSLRRAQALSSPSEQGPLWLAARSALSKAIFSGHLDTGQKAQAIARLSDLFDKTILSRYCIEGDPYSRPYVVGLNETLEGRTGIEQRMGLHVPARLILRVNGLPRGEDLRPGRSIKLVLGPFHAIVDKSEFAMDLYLHRQGLERVFCRRVRVGLGMNSSTPVGAWRVGRGEKMERPPWDTPLGSGMKRRILWGEEGYAFGTKGLWIGLEGIDDQTRGITDFGIHSTNDPNSIGRDNSLGCVRMADGDIDLVFSMLYDVHSTVLVRP